jgi:LysM repeat protein
LGKKNLAVAAATTAIPMVLGKFTKPDKSTGGPSGAGGKGGASAGRRPAPARFGTGGRPGGITKAATPPKEASKAGNKYRVEHGDTLSGIAKRAGITLAELRAANPQLDGKGIFRNTGVIIPKGATMPKPGYTGAVPYKGPKDVYPTKKKTDKPIDKKPGGGFTDSQNAAKYPKSSSTSKRILE